MTSTLTATAVTTPQLPVPDEFEFEQAFVSNPGFWRMSDKEAWATWCEVWARGPELTLEQARGYRVATAWRIARALLVRSGTLDMDQRLSDIPPDEIPNPHSPGEHPRLLERSRDVALALRLYDGSKRFPRLGYYGLQGLTDREHWPTIPEIVHFEHVLLTDVIQQLMKHSRITVNDTLRDRLGLTMSEGAGIIKLALREAQSVYSDDVETNRYLMQHWTMDYIARAKECGDLSNEIKGLKMLSQVQGLTSTKPADEMDEIMKEITAVEKESEQLPPPGQLRLMEPEDEA